MNRCRDNTAATSALWVSAGYTSILNGELKTQSSVCHMESLARSMAAAYFYYHCPLLPHSRQGMLFGKQ